MTTMIKVEIFKSFNINTYTRESAMESLSSNSILFTVENDNGEEYCCV